MGKDLSEMTLEELWNIFSIILKKHNTEYKNWYEVEKQSIISCLNQKNILRINHIGSSAVEGLISKPTIDILLEIDNELNIEYMINILTKNGWTLMSFQKNPYLQISFNKGYTKEGFEEKVYHLHVRYHDNWGELYFKDYLIKHKEIADEYGKLKLKLMDKYKFDRDKYTEGKTDFIMKYTQRAKEEYSNKYNP